MSIRHSIPNRAQWHLELGSKDRSVEGAEAATIIRIGPQALKAARIDIPQSGTNAARIDVPQYGAKAARIISINSQALKAATITSIGISAQAAMAHSSKTGCSHQYCQCNNYTVNQLQSTLYSLPAAAGMYLFFSQSNMKQRLSRRSL